MSKFFDLFKGLFDGGKNRQNKVPFLHESIDLKSFPVEEVEIWKSEGGYVLFSDLLNSTYRNILITGQWKYVTATSYNKTRGKTRHMKDKAIERQGT